MINTLIIEDEEPAARRLQNLIQSLEPEIVVNAVIDTVESAISWLNTHPQPDLIMLDIQLGDGLSFDIFKKTKVESYIIFTTAYDEYAIRAFELNSIDYLLKPVDENKLKVSLEKYKKFRTSSQEVNIGKLLDEFTGRNDKFKKRFVVNIANKIKVVETKEVNYFFSKEKSTFLSTSDNHRLPLDFSLDHIEEMVNPEQFFRINRQYLVRYQAISKIDVLSKSRIRIEIVPNPGEEILVSSARTSEFRQWLDK